MTISKKLFISAIAISGLIAGVTQASSSMMGFDYSLLKPSIAQSKKAIAEVATKCYNSKVAFRDIKVFAKNLYNQQKNALKAIKSELKQAYKNAKLKGLSTWFTQRQIYKAYKTLVYKNWKKNRLFPTF